MDKKAGSVTVGGALLIVDDEPQNLRAWRRTLTKYFDKIWFASTPQEGEAILKKHPIDYLVCDERLGPGNPRGATLVPKWRSLYPAIQKALIVSGGSEATIPMHSGIDDVVSKTIFPADLVGIMKGVENE